MGVNAWWKGAADLLDLRIRRRRDGAAISSDQHQRRSKDDLSAVDAGAAGPQFLSDHDVGDVLDAHGHARPRGDDDLRNVVGVLYPAAGADHITLPVLLNVVGATADIVGLDGRDHLIE